MTPEVWGSYLEEMEALGDVIAGVEGPGVEVLDRALHRRVRARREIDRPHRVVVTLLPPAEPEPSSGWHSARTCLVGLRMGTKGMASRPQLEDARQRVARS